MIKASSPVIVPIRDIISCYFHVSITIVLDHPISYLAHIDLAIFEFRSRFAKSRRISDIDILLTWIKFISGIIVAEKRANVDWSSWTSNPYPRLRLLLLLLLLSNSFKLSLVRYPRKLSALWLIFIFSSRVGELSRVEKVDWHEEDSSMKYSFVQRNIPLLEETFYLYSNSTRDIGRPFDNLSDPNRLYPISKAPFWSSEERIQSSRSTNKPW